MPLGQLPVAQKGETLLMENTVTTIESKVVSSYKRHWYEPSLLLQNQKEITAQPQDYLELHDNISKLLIRHQQDSTA
jgi:hypothetical protein